MRRLWSRSLRGQVIALILFGLAVAQLMAFFVYYLQQESVLRSLRDEQLLNRTASVVRLLAETPAASHRRILRSVSSRPLGFRKDTQPLIENSTPDARSRLLRRQLAALIGLAGDDAVRVSSAFPERDWRDWRQGRLRSERGRGSRQPALAVAVRLNDGNWLTAVATQRPARRYWQWPLLWSAGLAALILSGLMILLVRRITYPLAMLAREAERFGRGEAAAPLAERGPTEIRHTIQAFNAMRLRLERFVQDRMHMLAAISHDLRTPITALRVRAELIADEALRDKMLVTLDEMQRMTEASLVFVREEAAQEQPRAVDLAALVESLCDDFSDTGADVAFGGPAKRAYRCRPLSLKRALRNLLENALRYGERARVRFSEDAQTIRIEIDDDGPGIDPQDTEKVFEPFVRLETSRSRETGGVGLGLAIARTIVRRHGGDIGLQNRPAGGLRVTVELPKGTAG